MIEKRIVEIYCLLLAGLLIQYIALRLSNLARQLSLEKYIQKILAIKKDINLLINFLLNYQN